MNTKDDTLQQTRHRLYLPIAAMGLLAPWVAGTAMAFSSISVVLNALRLQKTATIHA